MILSLGKPQASSRRSRYPHFNLQRQIHDQLRTTLIPSRHFPALPIEKARS
jgi:hypothetical protein